MLPSASPCSHFLCILYSHFPKSSLCPWVPSVKDVAILLPSLSLALSLSIPYFLSFPFIPPSIHPSFLPFSSLPAPAAPAPSTPNMCYSDTAARTLCFSMPRDRQSITAWLSLSIGSEPPLAQPFGASVGVLIGHKGIGVCVSLSSGWSVGLVPALTEVDTGRASRIEQHFN